jgi:hypothetical protein
MLGRKRFDAQIQAELLLPFRVPSAQPNAQGQPPSRGGCAGAAKCRLPANSSRLAAQGANDTIAAEPSFAGGPTQPTRDLAIEATS